MKKIILLLTTISILSIFGIANAQDTLNNLAQITINPGKTLGNLNIGDTIESIKAKLDIKNGSNKLNIQQNQDDGSILNIEFDKNGKVVEIKLSSLAKKLIYKKNIITPLETNLVQLQKIFRSGKILYKSKDRFYLVLSSPQNGLDFYAEPIANLVDNNIKIKDKMCTQNQYKKKLYKCFVVTGVRVY